MSESFIKRTVMPAPAEVVFDWHERQGAFERLSPAFDPVVLEERVGGLAVGARTAIRLKVGPVWRRWVAVHTAYEKGRMFRDEQTEGPFAKWVHTHRFEPAPDGGTVMHDEIEYQLPLGEVGQTFGGGTARQTIERTFEYRHTLLRNDLLRHAPYRDRPRLTVAIAGSSGLIGSALKGFLDTGGHTVRPIRRTGEAPDAEAVDGADVVVNLAGAGIADQRWTAQRKRELVDSRVAFTRALVEGIKRAAKKPAVLLQGVAVGIYGDRGDELLTESAPPGPRGEKDAPFLSALCEDWEAEALKAEALGVRVVLVRTGLVQTARGGALAKLLVPFLAGAGGPVGSGKQWQSWIALEDILGIFHHAMWDEGVRGPVNGTAPEPVTSAEYGKVLGRVLNRPAFVPAPAPALRLLFGELADGGLLASQRAISSVLERQGFRFLFPQLEPALRFTLGRH